MKNINFERKYYIKDLFRPKQILNAFDHIEFDDLNTFLLVLQESLFQINKSNIIQIPVNNLNEYEQIVKIMNETLICEKAKLIIEVEKQDLFSKVLVKLPDRKFAIFTNFNNIVPNEARGTKWWRENPIYRKVLISANDYREKISAIINSFSNTPIRFFYLEFNYESFQHLKLSDLNMLEFWIHHMNTWMTAMKENDRIRFFFKDFGRKIFVGSDLTLYMNRNKTTWSFPLKDYLDCDGEIVPHKALNNLRQYMDLCPEAIYSLHPIRNWALIDYEQNIKIMTHLNEIPIIAGLINRWLYDSI